MSENANNKYRAMKYEYFFDFMDRDKDGYLTKEDFFSNAKLLAKSSKADKALQVAFQRDMMSWWVVYQGDDSVDAKVTKAEFVSRGWDYLSSPTCPEEIRKHYSLLFDYIDRDRDGEITTEELILYFKAHNRDDKSHVMQVFRKLDKDGDGLVTRDELVYAAVQFWCSDDPKTGCEWLYGPKEV